MDVKKKSQRKAKFLSFLEKCFQGYFSPLRPTIFHVNLKKHWLHNVLEHPVKLLKIPYKTCSLFILLEPSRGNALKGIKTLGVQ